MAARARTNTTRARRTPSETEQNPQQAEQTEQVQQAEQAEQTEQVQQASQMPPAAPQQPALQQAVPPSMQQPAVQRPRPRSLARSAPVTPVRATINWINLKEGESIRATASLNVGNGFAVHGIKIISGSKGEFVSMPAYKAQDGYKDIFHAVTAEARQQMNDKVMEAYEQKLAELMAESMDDELPLPDETLNM